MSNSSDVSGEEIVQLYLRDHVAQVTRPVKELKAFEKVMILAGESKNIHFTLNESDLSYYDNSGRMIFEPGTFTVFVGGSSTTVLEQTVMLDL